MVFLPFGNNLYMIKKDLFLTSGRNEKEEGKELLRNGGEMNQVGGGV